MAIYTILSYGLAFTLAIIMPIYLLPKRTDIDKARKPKFGLSEVGLKGWLSWTDIGLAPVGFIVYLILAAGLVAVFNLFPWFNASETQSLGFSLYSTGIDRVIAFLTLVIVAPVAEEIIFRGFLYGRLREKFHGQMPEWVGVMIAVFLTSLLFGIVHLQWNVGVNVFALSIVLCGLREITGSIYAGILLHVLKNFVAFYLLYML